MKLEGILQIQNVGVLDMKMHVGLLPCFIYIIAMSCYVKCSNHIVYMYMYLIKMFQVTDEEVCLIEGKACIFKYLQQLLVMGSSANKTERLKRIWEPSYT